MYNLFNQNENKTLLTVNETCEMLGGISRGTLYKLPLNKISIRKRRLYLKSEIIQFISDNMQGGKK